MFLTIWIQKQIVAIFNPFANESDGRIHEMKL